MTTFEVDPTRLVAASRQLRGVAARIDGDRERVDGWAAAVGHARLAGVLEEVGSSWSQKRELVLEQLRGTADALAAAAAAYADTEAGIARAAELPASGPRRQP